MTWAAGHGDLRTLRNLLDQHEVWVDHYDRPREGACEEAALRAALAAATRPAVAQIFRTDPGTPRAHAAYRAHRDDDNADARMNALAGLARSGDDGALARLLAMAGGRGDVPAYWRYEEVAMYRSLTSPR